MGEFTSQKLPDESRSLEGCEHCCKDLSPEEFSIGTCYCPCHHSPKVELPEWEKEFDKQFEEVILCQELKTVVPGVKQFIRQTLSHSTTQLVEKIMGEVDGLKKKEIEIPDMSEASNLDDAGEMMGEYESLRGFNQALQEVIKIISKYK